MRSPLQWLKDEGIFGWNYKHILTHPWIVFTEIYMRTKWFVQRGWRGYSDRDNWSIDSYLNQWMPTALRNLKRGYGYPVDMFPKEYQFSSDEIPKEVCDAAYLKWQYTLERMARGFEAAAALTEELPNPDSPRHKELTREMEMGLKLFTEHYFSLWD